MKKISENDGQSIYTLQYTFSQNPQISGGGGGFTNIDPWTYFTGLPTKNETSETIIRNL